MFDFNRDKRIKEGDYIQTQTSKGFFVVEKVVKVNQFNSQINAREDKTLLLLKHILNSKLEPKNVYRDICHTHWCEKVDESTREKIDNILNSNPKHIVKIESKNEPIQNLINRIVKIPSSEEEKLFKLLEGFKGSKMTDTEINSHKILDKFLYPSNYIGDGKVYLMQFANENLETNKKNLLLYKLIKWGEMPNM